MKSPKQLHPRLLLLLLLAVVLAVLLTAGCSRAVGGYLRTKTANNVNGASSYTGKSRPAFGRWYKGSHYDAPFRPSRATEKMNPRGIDTRSMITVFLDADGGVLIPSKIEVAYGNPYGELPTPTKEGHSFVGWYTETPGGTLVNSASIVSQNSDHTIYAHWDLNQYTISFEVDDGSECENITQGYNTPVTLPEPNKTGYTFLYWSLEERSGTKYTGTRMPSKDIKLYAQWEPNLYNVTLDARGGTVDESSVNVTFGEEYGTLPKPSNDPANFLWWYIEGTEKKVDDTTIVDMDMDHTLYAVWDINSVALNGMGGVVSPATVSVTYNTKYPTLPKPSLPGYTFNGWFLDEISEEEIDNNKNVDIPYPHTLYARWSINTHTVTFDFGNGTNTILELNYSDSIDYPTEPERRGHTFIGWDQIIENVPDNDVKITAQWELNKYNVTFIFDNNEESSSEGETVILVTFGNKYGPLPAPTKIGYNFLGWFTEKDGQITDSSIVDETEDHVLYAHWEPNKYTITFDVNGGEKLDNNERIIAFDAIYGKLTTPTREGHSFLGWFTEKLGGEEIISRTKMNKDSNHTLYAHWEVNKYTVTLDVNEGEKLVEDKLSVTFGEKYGNLPIPTKKGYTFLGWFTDKLGGDKITDKITMNTLSDHTLYAHWEVNRYTVTFDENEGSKLTDNKLSITFGKKYGNLPTVNRTGYTFLGWFTDKLGGDEITNKTFMNALSDHTLYAHWEANKYTVKLDVNGGSEFGVNEMIVTFDAPYGKLPTTSKTGYTFLGWFMGSDAVTSKTIVKIPNNHALQADWKINSYTVRFDVNGGDELTENKAVITFGTTYGNLPTPSRTGYSFSGWFESKYSEKEITSETQMNKENNHTLYAHWAPNIYTVTLDVNGGDALVEKEFSVTFGEKYGNLPTPNRTGYSFSGWLTAEDVLITSDTTANRVAGNHTLYAKWAGNTYVVTLDVNGGDEIEMKEISVAFKGTYNLLPTPRKSGYSFSGWFTEGGELITRDSTVTILQDHVLQARWTVSKYKVSFDAGDDEEEDVGSIDVTFGSAYGELPTPKDKTGYTFSGWADDIASGNMVNSTTVVDTPRNHTLYAVWTPNKYTITFDFGDGRTEEAVLSYKDRIIYPNENPSKSFYKFRRWCTNDIDDVEQCNVTHVPAKSVSFTATFDVDSSLVTGIAVGGAAVVLFIIVIVIIIILAWISCVMKKDYVAMDAELEADATETSEAVDKRIEGQVAAANILNDGDKKKKLKEALKDADKSVSLSKVLEDLNVNYEDTGDIDAIESFMTTDASSIVADAIRDDADLTAAAGYLALLYGAVRKQKEYEEFDEAYFAMGDVKDFTVKTGDGSVSFGGIVSCFTKKKKAIQFLLSKDGGSSMPNGVLFKVRSGKGYVLGKVDSDVDEILLELGSEFKIESVKEVTKDKYLVATLSLTSPDSDEDFIDI